MDEDLVEVADRYALNRLESSLGQRWLKEASRCLLEHSDGDGDKRSKSDILLPLLGDDLDI